MGMRVGSSSPTWSSYQTSAVSGWQQRQQGMKDLFSSLKSGDLASAQAAFANVQTNATSSNSALTKIGDALKSGDMAGAQQAAQAMQAGHGHHHVKAAPPSASNDAASTSTAAAATTDTATAFNSFIQNLEAALEQQGKTAPGANGQGSFLLNMPPPPPPAGNLASASATSTATTQDFFSGRGATPPSNAQLEASLESLIQQMSGTPGVNGSADTSGASSLNSNLQNSFSTLIGSMGGQSASASVSSFLQTLDNSLKSMDAATSSVNATA